MLVYIMSYFFFPALKAVSSTFCNFKSKEIVPLAVIVCEEKNFSLLANIE